MKAAAGPTRLFFSGFLLGATLFAGACGHTAQQQAFEQAAAREAQAAPEGAPALIAEYQRVIALQPGSDWARKAQARIEAVEAQVNARELHKSVFQEHGID